MSIIKIWGWENKPRTMLRYIKAGDIFCFKYDEQQYCFGRIVADIATGHVAEIFDYISKTPTINNAELEKATRLLKPLILDSYSLFDKKRKGEWRIIGCQENYLPSNMENVYFTYGIGTGCMKVDIYGNKTNISEEEQSKYIELSPKGDGNVKKMIKDKLERVKGE